MLKKYKQLALNYIGLEILYLQPPRNFCFIIRNYSFIWDDIKQENHINYAYNFSYVII
jgi:hypothetical protein